MDELDRLLGKYKVTRLRYMNERRDAEEALFAELVARVKALEGRSDPLAKARAAKAAKAAAGKEAA